MSIFLKPETFFLKLIAMDNRSFENLLNSFLQDLSNKIQLHQTIHLEKLIHLQVNIH